MPAMVIDAPLSIRCVFSDGRRAEYHLDDLPSPRLARDLATGLGDLIHPHGTADSGGTVVLYVRALRSMVRALAAAGFTGGAADLRPPVPNRTSHCSCGGGTVTRSPRRGLTRWPGQGRSHPGSG